MVDLIILFIKHWIRTKMPDCKHIIVASNKQHKSSASKKDLVAGLVVFFVLWLGFAAFLFWFGCFNTSSLVD